MERLGAVPAERILGSLEAVDREAVDLVVECAGPEVSSRYGTALIRCADYMPLSLTALADDQLFTSILEAAEAAGTRLLLPHGALAGMDALYERRERWREVTITFRKPPAHIAGRKGGSAAVEVLYDGPVRGAAAKFPRNVNAMVACALATVGLDRCRGVLVSDPALREMVAEVIAVDRDGSVLEIVKRQAGIGVSGTEMPDAVMRSIELATKTVSSGLQMV